MIQIIDDDGHVIDRVTDAEFCLSTEQAQEVEAMPKLSETFQMEFSVVADATRKAAEALWIAYNAHPVRWSHLAVHGRKLRTRKKHIKRLARRMQANFVALMKEERA